jgi:hypothetical protein
MRESSCVEVLCEYVVLPYVVFEIRYVSASAMPAYPCMVSFFLAVNSNLHAVVKH